MAAGFGALGWWDGAAWAQVEPATALPVSGGEDYQVAMIGLEAIIAGGPPTTLCDPLNNPGVVFENEQVLGDWPGPLGVAISAPWVIVPHLVEQMEDDGTYSAFAGELLAERGLDVPNPVMKQILHVDLEGDGINEVLVVAEDVSEGLIAQDGDYSIAFVRRTVSGDVQTDILGESVIVTADNPLVNSYSVGAVADLNGDARMEIVLTAAYYEDLRRRCGNTRRKGRCNGSPRVVAPDGQSIPRSPHLCRSHRHRADGCIRGFLRRAACDRGHSSSAIRCGPRWGLLRSSRPSPLRGRRCGRWRTGWQAASACPIRPISSVRPPKAC